MKMLGSSQDLIFAVSLSLAAHLVAAGMVISSLGPLPAVLLAPAGESAISVSLVQDIAGFSQQEKHPGKAVKMDSVIPRQEASGRDTASDVLEEKQIQLSSFASLDVYTNGVSANPGKSQGSQKNGLELANLGGPVAGSSIGSSETVTAPHVIPAYRRNNPPRYPASARQRGYEGLVLVSAEIKPDGRVGSLALKQSSGYAVLDNSAMDAVRNWLFRPGQRMGLPVPMWVDVPVRFALNE